MFADDPSRRVRPGFDGSRTAQSDSSPSKKNVLLKAYLCDKSLGNRFTGELDRAMTRLPERPDHGGRTGRDRSRHGVAPPGLGSFSRLQSVDNRSASL
jgi:hypothetical protein